MHILGHVCSMAQIWLHYMILVIIFSYCVGHVCSMAQIWLHYMIFIWYLSYFNALFDICCFSPYNQFPWHYFQFMIAFFNSMILAQIRLLQLFAFFNSISILYEAHGWWEYEGSNLKCQMHFYQIGIIQIWFWLRYGLL